MGNKSFLFFLGLLGYLLVFLVFKQYLVFSMGAGALVLFASYPVRDISIEGPGLERIIESIYLQPDK